MAINAKKPAARKSAADMKGEFLSELVERYNYWSAIGTKESDKYAEAYERMICVFTTPEEGKKE